MKIVYFTHSLLSCWNHGNAHFLRGVLRELGARGHDVLALEPEGNWSLANLLADHGQEGLTGFQKSYPELRSQSFDPAEALDGLVDAAELVIVHEWNSPALVAELGRLRKSGARFTLLFHDTHHRAVSDPGAMRMFDLSGYDGILAFGETLAEVYRSWGWQGRAWVWHEAADVRHFKPPAEEGARQGLVWIGNWGDGERTTELESLLFKPAALAGLTLDIFGVRYPADALATLARYNVSYHGWAANAEAPAIFAGHMATVHVPRRFYTSLLPGIPTIRVFEALACGIPLVSAPWEDSEHLFRPGQDYLTAATTDEMTLQLERLKQDPELRQALAASGRETILARHTCGHRADELLAIHAGLASPSTERSVA